MHHCFSMLVYECIFIVVDISKFFHWLLSFIICNHCCIITSTNFSLTFLSFLNISFFVPICFPFIIHCLSYIIYITTINTALFPRNYLAISSRRSFTFGLLSLVLTWGSLRTCFWLATTIGPKSVTELDSNAYFVVLKVIFYWVPFALQYTSYSIFSLFLGKVVYRNEWKRDRCKRKFVSGFIISNAVLFLFVMAWATWSTLIVIRSPLIPVQPAHHHNASHRASPSPASYTQFVTQSESAQSGSAQSGGGHDPIPWVPTHHATCEIQMLDAVLEAVMGSSFTVLFLSFTALTMKYLTTRDNLQLTQRMLVFQPKHLGALCIIMSTVFLSRAGKCIKWEKTRNKI